MKEQKELAKGYNKIADEFLFSRTKGKSLSGFQNRELEQPTMFKLVPKNLKNNKVLDIGCGPGIHLKQYIKRGAEGFGIDISKEMIKLAKKYCPKGKFKIGSVYDLKFKDDSFDMLTASFSMDHVKDLDKAVGEVKRVLKKDGLFIFSAPHPVVYMFRVPNEGKYIPSNSYFDKKPVYYNIAGSERMVDFPRTFEDYTKPFLKKGFKLIDFVESKPKKDWRKRCKVDYDVFFKIPLLAFFKWKKD